MPKDDLEIHEIGKNLHPPITGESGQSIYKRMAAMHVPAVSVTAKAMFIAQENTVFGLGFHVRNGVHEKLCWLLCGLPSG